MIPKQLQQFIVQLFSATEDKKVNWAAADASAYYCDHKNHTLHISSHFDPESEASVFWFRIVTNGKVTPFSVRHHEADYDTMSRLYEAVIANANDVGNDIADFFD